MSSGKVQKSHRDMYKARTPPWKETYRKRCLDRLRDSREKLKSKFRKLSDFKPGDTFIEELMKEEWKNLRDEAGNLEGSDDIETVDIDKILDLFDDIQDELRKEELKMLEEYERYEESLQLEEKTLCSAINKLCTEEVICPLCKRNPLMVNKSVIFCRCSLRIDTEQDCLTLSNVKQQLMQGIEQHSQVCESEPVFSVNKELASNSLLMTCPDCDWMSVVI